MYAFAVNAFFERLRGERVELDGTAKGGTFDMSQYRAMWVGKRSRDVMTRTAILPDFAGFVHCVFLGTHLTTQS